MKRKVEEDGISSDYGESKRRNRQRSTKPPKKRFLKTRRKFESSTSSSPPSKPPEPIPLQSQSRASVRMVIKASTQATGKELKPPVPTNLLAYSPPSRLTHQDVKGLPGIEEITSHRDLIQDSDVQMAGANAEQAREANDHSHVVPPTQSRFILKIPPANPNVTTKQKERTQTVHDTKQGSSVVKTQRSSIKRAPPITEVDDNAEFSVQKTTNRRRPPIERALPDLNSRKRTTNLETAAPGTVERQNGSCKSRKYQHTKRCTACIAKKAGEPCRFNDIRAFTISASGIPDGPAIWHGVPLLPDRQRPTKLQFNDTWYNKPIGKDVNHVKKSAAAILLPVLQAERTSLVGREHKVIRRIREIEVRVTCDRCLTSVFSTSFLCTECGREFCLECYASLESAEEGPALLHQKLTLCGNAKLGLTHGPKSFLPVSRLEIRELDDNIEEMKELLGNLDTKVVSCDQMSATSEHEVFTQVMEELPSAQEIPTSRSSSSSLTSLSSRSGSGSSSPILDTSDIATATHALVESVLEDPARVDSLESQTLHHSNLGEELFQSIWKKGKTIVVTGLLDKMAIKWTPEYFIQHYGDNLCAITNCDTEMVHQSDVSSFFSQFGDYPNRSESILKLKDWPPSADFKNAFPNLFDDFQRAVPAPNYTRRDGFYNISAHFPLNGVAPDMGPKMYNAFKSREDGYGSTRLHMDMADAVNIMLYAAPLPGDTVGYAVWDIYPSESSAKIRKFLKEEYPLETSPVQYVDPIHSQYFYLTPALRRKLFEKYKVSSWRIYQKPGDAVFIPAGCAHQVCNLADCIKVAVDFVSPENLSRCGQLTKEFRSENEKVTWKEDILQLSNMCWSAWENTRQMEKLTSLED
ncbi:hypothetical protein M408DRAFT_101995 [Serendipita vermifera MAFF 305830]|uniref:JmjC domain-containing protein n=1 Tax=Serendipita vermifera MAFF 305830 TaxID=933852 RepID=A0A0C2W5B9_SERVB|nr:hypothetical protein M408DRAFT_101995 [Serendipita vermifera MAFF 305830]